VLQQKCKLLFLQGNEYLKAGDLVQVAATQYGLSAQAQQATASILF
jgi:hypothetical protein